MRLSCGTLSIELLLSNQGYRQLLGTLRQAMKFIEHISEVYVLEKNRLSVGATDDIAFYPEHATTEHKLIRLVDTAMYYQKKRAPSTQGIFFTQLGKQLSREQFLKNGLEEAIAKDQFRLVFRPIVFSEDKRICSFEALLRWQFDDQNIPSDEFTCIAEQYGMICKIGEWVLN
jgi:predicted signal transduction protein with EAL and GGDEF domain